MVIELMMVELALAASLSLRPWRMLTPDGQRIPLLTPTMAVLVLLPWVWALPWLHHTPLQLHWSGAPLVMLMLGWPLAIPVLVFTGMAAGLIANAALAQVLSLIAWQGVVPATLALVVGAMMRRWLPHHVFVYVLGRGFAGSVLSLFFSSLIAQALGHQLPNVNGNLTRVAYWLIAWGDAFLTGMMCAIFVAYRPQWLATWSDDLYLPPKTAQ